MKTSPTQKKDSWQKYGFATLATISLLALAFAFAVIIVTTTLSSRQASKTLQGQLTATQLAESGIQKTLYCLNATSGTNCGGTYGNTYVGETNISIGSGSFTTTLSGSGTTRTITSVGTSSANFKQTAIVDVTTIPPTDNTTFSYALQSGNGGAHLDNNSSISGTIYSSGTIDCQSTNAVITGDAYVSLSGGKIDSCKVSYDGHADRILNSKVLRDAYFKNSPADISGTTVSGTKYPNSTTPTTIALPSFDLDFWRNSAQAGGTISGNYTPANNSNLGPIKINGDLTMDNNINVTIKGPVWVTGNITTGNNVSFTLDSAFGGYSTTILADDPSDNVNHGKINIRNQWIRKPNKPHSFCRYK